jgi:hypothetical protein
MAEITHPWIASPRESSSDLCKVEQLKLNNGHGVFAVCCAFVISQKAGFEQSVF